VRRMDVDKTAGLRRVTWNLRADPPPPGAAPAPGAAGQAGRGGGAGGGGFGGGRGGNQPPLVAVGTYRATLGKQVGDTVTPIGPPQTFAVTPLLQ
jgi:hypothetical protein